MNKWTTSHEIFRVEFTDGSGCILRVSLGALIGTTFFVLILVLII